MSTSQNEEMVVEQITKADRNTCHVLGGQSKVRATLRQLNSTVMLQKKSTNLLDKYKMEKIIMNRTVQNRLWQLVIIVLLVNIFAIQRVFASDSIEKAGDIIQIIIPGVAYGSTFYLDDPEGRNQFYKSFATTIVVTYGLKIIINKKRPNGSDWSFPSGHTSAAFQGASFIHKRYGIKYSIPAYILASFVGYSRVESNNHYVEDVLAGAAIGILSSFYFTKPYKGFNIAPIAGNGTYGISFSKQW